MQTETPQFPAGAFTAPDQLSEEDQRKLIDELAHLPAELRAAVEGLTDVQLETKYRNWTIRQIAHHIADSHVNSYIRFKWTLTEEEPTIKAYDEGRWSDLSESQNGSVQPSLLLLDGLHARWCQLLSSLSAEEYERAFIHPETSERVTLGQALAYYVWHGKHHTAQILLLRKHL